MNGLERGSLEGVVAPTLADGTRQRPLLLVDFDGVVNVVGRLVKGQELEADFTREGYRIRVPVGTAQRFARLEAELECVWATTWGQEASVLGRFLGFGANWPAIFIASGGRLAATGKLPEVRRWCEFHAAGRPVAWVDDDLWPDVHDWATARGQTLIVRTLPEEGVGYRNSDHAALTYSWTSPPRRSCRSMSGTPLASSTGVRLSGT